uniref:Uncharacterized protein n=1 Tax=Romanomermis culicivorax TaxID=13658 RepID=A0A915IS70_ROMCU
MARLVLLPHAPTYAVCPFLPPPPCVPFVVCDSCLEVFTKLNISSYDLNIDVLDMHATLGLLIHQE